MGHTRSCGGQLDAVICWMKGWEDRNTHLTVFRTLLKYTKLTATAMVCRRIAESVMSPRHWRETGMAISKRWRKAEKPPKNKVPSKEGKRFPAGEDKSDQALLHFCSGGRETEGRRRRARGGEREADRAAVWGVGGAERERKTEGGMEDYNSLNKSLWADRSELRELHAAHPTPRRLQGPSDMCKLRVERTGTTSGGM